MTNGQRNGYQAEKQLGIIMDKPVATVRDAWLSALAALQAGTANASLLQLGAHDVNPHQQRHIIRGAVHTLLEAIPPDEESDDDSDDL